MKQSSTQYRRTLSEEEIHEGKIMIMKEALKFFPKPFKKFAVKIGDKSVELAVEAVDCQCRGPQLPHQHFWLPVKDAKARLRWEHGASVTVSKDKAGSYSIDSR
jgi:hypothetical protein